MLPYCYAEFLNILNSIHILSKVTLNNSRFHKLNIIIHQCLIQCIISGDKPYLWVNMDSLRENDVIFPKITDLA